MKILIIRFSSIGDIILTTPIARAIKEQIPGSEVHFLTKIQFIGLLQNNPYVDKVFGYANNDKEIITALQSEGFDQIVDLHNNLRSRIFSFKLGVTAKRLNKINWKKWLIVKLKHNILPDQHIVDRCFDVVSNLNVLNDNKGLDYFISPTSTLPDDIKIHNQFICYAIGGQHQTKKMPLNKMIELCTKSTLPIVLIGGKEDESIGHQIENQCINVQSLCGKLSIEQSALVMQKSSWVITHDTGMMHIAAALKKKIISIWGNTIPEFGMYPYLPDNDSKQFEVNNLDCRPCSKLGHTSCPKKHFNCMNQQNTELMIQHIMDNVSTND